MTPEEMAKLESAGEVLEKKWPGMNDALISLIKGLEDELADPWLQAKVKRDGPKKFKETMVNLLQPSLEKMDHKILAEVAANALSPMIFDALANAGKVLEKGTLWK